MKNADHLLDRARLKQQVMRWRTATLVVLLAAGLVFLTDANAPLNSHRPHIARVSIEGIIVDDILRDEMLEELRDDDNVKAVIVRLDTPGGTGAGGQQLYQSLSEIAEEKPVVAVMRTMATSAGYMTAIAADHIVAQESTITGSIGVILQSFNIEKLAKEYGVEPITIKSGENKGAPSYFEGMTKEQRAILQGVIDDFHNYFVTIVAENRELDKAELAKLADGRVFSGRQALELGLIDELGSEKQALAWLEENKNLDTDTVIDHEPNYEPEQWWQNVKQIFGGNPLEFPSLGLDGLLLIWQPRAVFSH